VTLWQAFVLGLVQGLTEFLPVSSSGHLVLAERLLGLESVGLSFEVWVHLGTLVAVGAALYRELLDMAAVFLPSADPARRRAGKRWWVAVLVGTIPAVVVGLAAKDAVETAFASVRVVGVNLIVTAAILFASRFFRGGDAAVTPRRALLIGAAQALAILPGISRSGATLTAGWMLGLSGPQAARFSFLLAFPAILGAGVLEAQNLAAMDRPAVLAVSFLTACVSGYAAIRMVWRVMAAGRLHWFAPYCAAVGALVLFLA
jgi:undecaprenyl-diphosphatase